MKVSELIKQLSDLKEKHGDLDVMTEFTDYDDYGYPDTCEKVDIEEAVLADNKICLFNSQD